MEKKEKAMKIKAVWVVGMLVGGLVAWTILCGCEHQFMGIRAHTKYCPLHLFQFREATIYEVTP